MKKILSPLIIPLVLSLALHGIFIAGTYRLRVFDPGSGPKDMPIAALLIPGEIGGPPFKPRKAAGFSDIAHKVRKPRTAETAGPSSAHDKTSGEGKSPAAADNETAGEKYAEKSFSMGVPLQPPEAAGPLEAEVSPPLKLPDVPTTPQASGNNTAVRAASAQPDSGKIRKKTVLLKKRREKLLYSIYWLDIYVGNAMIEASSRDGRITIKSQVHSAPFISVFYKVEDYAESTVINGSAVRFRIRQHEGKYRSDKETVFDPGNKQVTFFNYIKRTTDDHVMDTPEVWDLISGFYYLRSRPIEVGETLYIDVFDSDKFFRTEVSVLGKERIKMSKDDEVDTVKVRPVIKSEGLFQKSGDVFIWLTDDDSKTPVKIETRVPIGKVVAVLTSEETE